MYHSFKFSACTGYSINILDLDPALGLYTMVVSTLPRKTVICVQVQAHTKGFLIT